MSNSPFITSQIIPIIVVILIMVKFRNIINSFINSSTTNASTAKTLDELNVRRGGIFNRLQKRGVIIEVMANRYYLNEENLAKYNEKRRKIAIFSLLVLIIFLLILNLVLIKNS